MNNHKAIAFFSGFPDRRFTDEIAGRLEKELPVRRCIVFITACPVDYQQNDEDSAGMHRMFEEYGIGFERFCVVDARMAMNMGRTTVDIWESLVPYEGLGFADITMIGHFSYEDTERLRLMKAVSMERPVCAMEDESAIFIKNGKADIIGIIHKVEKGEIKPFTEEDVRL